MIVEETEQILRGFTGRRQAELEGVVVFVLTFVEVPVNRSLTFRSLPASPHQAMNFTP